MMLKPTRLAASIPLIYWMTVGLIALVRTPRAMGATLGPIIIVLNVAAMICTPVLAVSLVRAFFRDAPRADKAWLATGLIGGIASWAFLLWLLYGIGAAFGGR